MGLHMEDVLRPRKKIGRMRRTRRLGYIIPYEGGDVACKGEGEDKEAG